MIEPGAPARRRHGAPARQRQKIPPTSEQLGGERGEAAGATTRLRAVGALARCLRPCPRGPAWLPRGDDDAESPWDSRPFVVVVKKRPARCAAMAIAVTEYSRCALRGLSCACAAGSGNLIIHSCSVLAAFMAVRRASLSSRRRCACPPDTLSSWRQCCCVQEWRSDAQG